MDYNKFEQFFTNNSIDNTIQYVMMHDSDFINNNKDSIKNDLISSPQWKNAEILFREIKNNSFLVHARPEYDDCFICILSSWFKSPYLLSTVGGMPQSIQNYNAKTNTNNNFLIFSNIAVVLLQLFMLFLILDDLNNSISSTNIRISDTRAIVALDEFMKTDEYKKWDNMHNNNNNSNYTISDINHYDSITQKLNSLTFKTFPKKLSILSLFYVSNIRNIVNEYIQERRFNIETIVFEILQQKTRDIIDDTSNQVLQMTPPNLYNALNCYLQPVKCAERSSYDIKLATKNSLAKTNIDINHQINKIQYDTTIYFDNILTKINRKIEDTIYYTHSLLFGMPIFILFNIFISKIMKNDNKTNKTRRNVSKQIKNTTNRVYENLFPDTLTVSNDINQTLADLKNIVTHHYKTTSVDKFKQHIRKLKKLLQDKGINTDGLKLSGKKSELAQSILNFYIE